MLYGFCLKKQLCESDHVWRYPWDKNSCAQVYVHEYFLVWKRSGVKLSMWRSLSFLTLLLANQKQLSYKFSDSDFWTDSPGGNLFSDRLLCKENSFGLFPKANKTGIKLRTNSYQAIFVFSDRFHRTDSSFSIEIGNSKRFLSPLDMSSVSCREGYRRRRRRKDADRLSPSFPLLS